MIKKVLNVILVCLAPLVMMAYGWYLGQLHQSGYDLAGILLFLTGLAALILALPVYHFTRRFGWHDRWYASLLTGVTACLFTFTATVLIARLHK